MSEWLAYLAIGVVVGFAAGLLGIGGGGGVFLLALAGAVILLILYRRVFQGRGITGPGARRR
jgi:uncharacterized membrane protein YeaQ/YmgE (transglycosylase-associated protein family)